MIYVVSIEIKFGPEALATMDREVARVAAGELYDAERLAKEIEKGLVVDCRTLVGPNPQPAGSKVVIGDRAADVAIVGRKSD